MNNYRNRRPSSEELSKEAIISVSKDANINADDLSAHEIPKPKEANNIPFFALLSIRKNGVEVSKRAFFSCW